MEENSFLPSLLIILPLSCFLRFGNFSEWLLFLLISGFGKWLPHFCTFYCNEARLSFSVGFYTFLYSDSYFSAVTADKASSVWGMAIKPRKLTCHAFEVTFWSPWCFTVKATWTDLLPVGKLAYFCKAAIYIGGFLYCIWYMVKKVLGSEDSSVNSMRTWIQSECMYVCTEICQNVWSLF